MSQEIEIEVGYATSAYVSSVKNMLPLGWILRSFMELNWRPKKLSKMTVALLGEFGLTRTRAEGRFPLPRVARRREPLKGPVAPLVICAVSGRESYKTSDIFKQICERRLTVSKGTLILVAFAAKASSTSVILILLIRLL